MFYSSCSMICHCLMGLASPCSSEEVTPHRSCRTECVVRAWCARVSIIFHLCILSLAFLLFEYCSPLFRALNGCWTLIEFLNGAILLEIVYRIYVIVEYTFDDNLCHSMHIFVYTFTYIPGPLPTLQVAVCNVFLGGPRRCM